MWSSAAMRAVIVLLLLALLALAPHSTLAASCELFTDWELCLKAPDCAFDWGINVCRNATCSDRSQDRCTESNGCAWDSAAYLCHAVGAAVPCDRYWGQACPLDRCLWLSELSYCHAGDGSPVPCERYLDGVGCTRAACVWFDGESYGLCRNAGEAKPCSLFGAGECPAPRCYLQYDTYCSDALLYDASASTSMLVAESTAVALTKDVEVSTVMVTKPQLGSTHQASTGRETADPTSGAPAVSSAASSSNRATQAPTHAGSTFGIASEPAAPSTISLPTADSTVSRTHQGSQPPTAFPSGERPSSGTFGPTRSVTGRSTARVTSESSSAASPPSASQTGPTKDVQPTSITVTASDSSATSDAAMPSTANPVDPATSDGAMPSTADPVDPSTSDAASQPSTADLPSTARGSASTTSSVSDEGTMDATPSVKSPSPTTSVRPTTTASTSAQSSSSTTPGFLPCSPGVVGLPSTVRSRCGSLAPVFGASCSLECRAGYRTEVAGNALCGRDGAWAIQQLPTCTPVQCGPCDATLGPFPNALSGPHSTAFQDTCTFDCNVGFVGAAVTFACGSSGKWEPQIPQQRFPVCAPRVCPAKVGALPADVAQVHDCFGVVGDVCPPSFFRCSPGMVLSNPVAWECEASGLWAGGALPCRSCPSGHFERGGFCLPFTACALGQSYEAAKGNATHDRVCATVQACTAGVTFESIAPSLTTNRVCQPVQGWPRNCHAMHTSHNKSNYTHIRAGTDLYWGLVQECVWWASTRPSRQLRTTTASVGHATLAFVGKASTLP